MLRCLEAAGGAAVALQGFRGVFQRAPDLAVHALMAQALRLHELRSGAKRGLLLQMREVPGLPGIVRSA